ncbi:hypothetical protein WN51_03941 [Melipona quadrifasciata]|uniref:Uncharacterized protein n=1 Tax=Melipona quadrifasciata TaxID=166423 RepID=A0A0M8ZPI8_9HYME|nr:hypothetical protein WN51_03941 [Melipona quadrifasciata]
MSNNTFDPKRCRGCTIADPKGFITSLVQHKKEQSREVSRLKAKQNYWVPLSCFENKSFDVYSDITLVPISHIDPFIAIVVERFYHRRFMVAPYFFNVCLPCVLESFGERSSGKEEHTSVERKSVNATEKRLADHIAPPKVNADRLFRSFE